MAIRKHIVSPEARRAGETVERTRAANTENLKSALQREADLLRPDGEADVTSPAMQAGRRLPRSLVVERLKKLNPAIRYARSRNYPDNGGIYIADGSCYIIPTDDVPGRFVCGIPHDYVNEFDLRLTETEAMPDPTVDLHWLNTAKLKGRIRGWRSILLKLAQDGLISLDRAERAFHITEGRSSKNWQDAIN